MITPKGHRVITVERQGGYAARCEVEVDGQRQLCDATFSCDTRTEARAAITHTNPAIALAAGTKKAAAVASCDGQSPSRKDPNMTDTTPNLPIVPQPAAIHESLRHLFDRDRIDDEISGVLIPIELPAGDPLRIDLTARREYAPNEPGETGPLERHIVYVYDLATGKRLMTRALPVEWWHENLAHLPKGNLQAWMDHQPNQWLATDRHLLISAGRWWRGPDSDAGDLVYTSVSQVEAAYREKYRSTQRHWGKLHAPAIAAFQPAWADRVEFHGDEDLLEAEGMTFCRSVGRVTIRLAVPRHAPEQQPPGSVDGFHPDAAGAVIDMSDLRHELSPDDAAALAVSLTTALAAVTGKPVQIEATVDATGPTPA